MNYIIVEDEYHAATHLEHQISMVDEKMKAHATLDSVKQTVSWLRNNHTDLIFMDVQLGDGLSFEVFDHVDVKTPVIFTTSFDQYAIKAFDVNSIAYLLKPIKTEGLKIAIDKYILYNSYHHQDMVGRLSAIHTDFQKRFFIQSGSSIKSIPSEEISYFRVQDKRHLILTTVQGHQHLLDNTLERLEQRLNPEMFFRINRQFIVNINSIRKMSSHDRGRIKVETLPECKEEMIVSIEKVVHFKNWLNR